MSLLVHNSHLQHNEDLTPSSQQRPAALKVAVKTTSLSNIITCSALCSLTAETSRSLELKSPPPHPATWYYSWFSLCRLNGHLVHRLEINIFQQGLSPSVSFADHRIIVGHSLIVVRRLDTPRLLAVLSTDTTSLQQLLEKIISCKSYFLPDA